MDDLASPSSVLPGPSHVPCWRPPDRQLRKTGTHDIFQGVNLHQLRRLFQVAGEQDAEQKAKLVWGGAGSRRTERGGTAGDPEEEEVCAEVEIGLAQALVGLRVRARTKNGIRAEGHRDAHRRARGSASHRFGDAASRQSVDELDDDTEAGCDKKELDEEGGSGERLAVACSDKEMVDLSSNRSGARDRDPERHLHRIRH